MKEYSWKCVKEISFLLCASSFVLLYKLVHIWGVVIEV